MKRILEIFFLFLTFKCGAQTTINKVSLDTMGRLKWSITFPSPDLRIEIQRNIKGKWTAIFQTGHHIDYFDEAPKTPELMTFADSCTVPLDKGTNKYRIIITAPTKLESEETTVNLLSTNNKHVLYGKDNYITLDKGHMFWIYDSTGKQIRQDAGRMINVTALNRGFYYIVIDRDIYEFTKK